jgi:hypothetical protein
VCRPSFANTPLDTQGPDTTHRSSNIWYIRLHVTAYARPFEENESAKYDARLSPDSADATAIVDASRQLHVSDVDGPSGQAADAVALKNPGHLPALAYTKTGKMCRIYNSYFSLGFVCFVPATKRYLTIVHPLTQPMHVADNGAAESDRVVLEEAGYVPMWESFAKEFPLRVDLRTLDQDKANIKAENSTNYTKSDTTRALHPCEIHITSIAQRGAFQPISRDISGMIKTTLACRPAGHFPLLVKAATIVLRASVVIVPTSPPDRSTPSMKRRSARLDILLTDSSKDMKRRGNLEDDVTGDWDSLEVLWHTLAREPDLDEWSWRVAGALFDGPPPMFNRGRWIKSTVTLRSFALPHNCHKLFFRAVSVWLQLLSGVAEDKVVIISDDKGALLGAGSWTVDSDSEDDEVRTAPPQSSEDWVKFNAEQKIGTESWNQTEPAHRLLVAAIQPLPMVWLMNEQLHCSSRAWQQEQFYLATQSGNRPLYRMTVAARGDLTDPFFKQSKRLLFDEGCWNAMPESAITQGNANLAFAMIAKGMGGIKQMLDKLQKSTPTMMFLLLDPLADITEISIALNALPDCLKDDLALVITELYDTAEKLRGEE